MNRALFVLLTALTVAGAAAPAQERQAKDAESFQDFVFLGESRPVLVRMHVRVDDKTLESAWHGYMKDLFGYLDVNGDGVLSSQEAERVPATEQILGGGLGRGIGAIGGFGSAPAPPALTALDTDKDSKVTLTELVAYYRKNGLAPFQFQLQPPPANPIMAFVGGGSGEPSVQDVSEAAFNLLDANKDGKLTKEELAAASAAFLRLDDNDDEIVTTRELVPNTKPAAGGMGMMGKMPFGGKVGSKAAGNQLVVPISTPGETPAELVRQIQERYGSKADKDSKKLSRTDLGLEKATFRALDTNGDGVLDAGELAGFVKRPADLEVLMHVEDANPRVELMPERKQTKALARMTQARDGLVHLDLGATRLDLRSAADSQANALDGFVRELSVGQLKQADKDNNGVIDEKEAQNNRLMRGLFKGMDRDGDGKVTEKEITAFLSRMRELQKGAEAACVALVFSDQSRGLFDTLDVNRDGRLSVREMRGAVKLLAELDRAGKGHLTKSDIPKSYELKLRSGPADTGASAAGIFAAIYGGGGSYDAPAPTVGPEWFRKMDKNRDGDVSRREFLFSDEAFRRIDTDGDGLISAAEATAAAARIEPKRQP